MARPLWFVNLLMKTFPNIKFIAKLTKIPIFGRLVDNLLFKGDDIIYLPQDKVIEIDKLLGEYQEYVLPSQILNHFITKAKKHWIMNFCICRTSMKCVDYPQDLGCLFLGEAVLGINPQLGRLVSKDEALDHIKKCNEAGLVHLIGRNKLDAQWLGIGPGEKLLTICNCDPCCCLWRVSPFLTPRIGSKIKKMPGIKIQVTNKCTGCGTCRNGICFVDAIKEINGKSFISEACKGCSRCVSICPQKAIELKIEDVHYIQRSIEELDELVDLT
ncbi:MAG: Electron transport complex subunit RsxB [Candidatus Lokiarchaeum sp. GC14_75]|nr:MAG: Electron transport complex subunit RsxB [Candidatus Lokiarchaeum sp. GC14_75]